MTNHPNRSRRADAPARSPSPTEVRELRERHGLTQTQAATLVHANLRGYQRWELGERVMRADTWELMRIKLGEIKASPRTRA